MYCYIDGNEYFVGFTMKQQRVYGDVSNCILVQHKA